MSKGNERRIQGLWQRLRGKLVHTRRQCSSGASACTSRSPQHGQRGVAMKTLGMFLAALFSLAFATPSFAPLEDDRSKMLRRVKPAVVLVRYEIKARIQVQTPQGPREGTDAITNHGSGFIINPNCYVVTNGHVVEEYHESNSKRLQKKLIERFVSKHLLHEETIKEQKEMARSLSDEEKKKLHADLVGYYYPRRSTIMMNKQLHVDLSNGDVYIAEIKVYSPPIQSIPGKLSLLYETDNEERDGEVCSYFKN
jgi:hypothetical protein